MPENDNAERFVERLDAHRSPEQREKYRRYFKLGEGEYGEGDEFIGVRMGQVFALAKEFIEHAAGGDREAAREPDPRGARRRRQHHGQAGAAARRRPKAAGRSCSSSTCGARTGSTTGIWSTWRARTSSAATCSTSRATSSTSWPAPRTCGSAARRSSAPTTSSGRATWTTPSGSPSCCSTTRGPDPQGRRRLAARGGQEGPPATAGRFLDAHAASDAAHDAPLRHRASGQRGAEALPKHEEGRVGRVGIGAVQEGDRGGPRCSPPRPTKPGEGLSVNGRAARAAPIPRTSRPPTFRELRSDEDRTTRFIGA